MESEEERMRKAIERSSSAFLYRNAVFMAERLAELNPSIENRSLLARCLYSANEIRRCYSLLQASAELKYACLYMYSLCCFHLGLHIEARDVLTNSVVMHTAETQLLLGKVHQALKDPRKAELCFLKALDIDNTLWEAYEGLSAVGIDSENIPPRLGDLVMDQGDDYMTQDESLFGEESPLIFRKPRDAMSSDTTNGVSSSEKNKLSVENDAMEDRKDKPEPFSFLKVLGAAVYKLSLFECSKSLELLKSLPPNFFWGHKVQVLVGRCHYEMMNYLEAKVAFENARSADPYNAEGMEIFSTVLWHLREDKLLAHLGHELIKSNRHSPETWIVIGNCFSLLQHHETSIKFCRRALQINPQCTYALTLVGHELCANEHLNEAASSFTQAITQDPRHYNAWYGLGLIYMKRQKPKDAEYYFKRAIEINPGNSVLFACLALSYYQRNEYSTALVMFNKALELDPKNPMARYQKARLHVARGDYTTAMADLEEIAQLSTTEPAVFLLMGNIYRLLGNPTQALKCFYKAHDINPQRNRQVLLSAIENLMGKKEGEIPLDTLK